MLKLLLKATLCCSPPESFSGNEDFLLIKPTVLSILRAFSIFSLVYKPFNSNGNKIFSSTVKVGIRLKFWKIKPMLFLLNNVFSSSLILAKSISEMIRLPESILSMQLNKFKKVDLPEPLAPK